ncbi:putative phosphatidylinositol (35) kinase [Leptomonas pyrrhocoris]|uniref:Putative phosphatidylinositol (35) kinase n=1 Tax=Leptomonas pyrrhocoris TaxID=157538 RepID=A0A0N0VFD9_LEPPY|nr:putative phosphatidylinositol (35) kinase [Leptomonas pyrrhocoris]KPA80902.1 putative phosphatidylinositol (35) kinase [Leptomonas pyrrhocoris]|eukprot:XP_015659341.1 putative phosphatidylinositol (35) kinase [Leptomonas pyrrhocoris]
MSTDRSLWVEDKYALRCRRCGEKFTMFRRRHHCRRCGQVFCYECLYSAQGTAASQSLMDNMYEWLAPSPTRPSRISTEKVTTAALSSSPSSPGSLLSSAVDEDVQAELSTRMCRRCAATILENAERESSASRLEFRAPSIHNNANVKTSQPLAISVSPATDATATASPPPTSPSQRATLAFPNEPHVPSLKAAAASPPPHVDASPRQNQQRQGVEENGGEKWSWRAVRHEETAEEREVTYSIGRVQPRVAASMADWWAAHQAAMRIKEQRKLSTSGELGGAPFTLTTPGAVVHVLTDPVTFTALFCVQETKSPTVAADNGTDWVRHGSAAVHEDAQLSVEETAFLDAYGAACTAHILSRICRSVEALIPENGVSHLSQHLAAVAWHVVQQTTVALGSTIDEHVALFCVPCPALPPQCIVYPGLICALRLPSKRVMTACNHPRILLLAGHLSHPVQPAEDLVDYVRSYSGHLDKLFQRLAVWNPDVIVVEGGMHHYLRERIETESHMRLLLHVGRDFLVQLSWCLHADIIADLQYVGVADLASTTPMGECARFEVLELAEEELFCAFTGFSDVCFHTLVFRGSGVIASAKSSSSSSKNTSNADRGGATQHQWNALEQLGREAITAAYHAAMQSHWVRTLLHSSSGATSSFATGLAAAVVHSKATAATTSRLTLNSGCQYPPEVLSACQRADAPLSLVRDTVVLNVVLMNHLFESSNSAATPSGSIKGTVGVSSASSASAAATAAASNMTRTLTRAQSSDLTGDVSSPASHASSAGASRTDLAGLHPSKLGTPALTQPSLPQAESSAAHTYAVVQQKVALTFYGHADDSLCVFLFSRCTSAESQLLYLHGGHRVRVTVTRAASRGPVMLNSSDGSSRSSGALPGEAARTPQTASNRALEDAQTVTFQLTAVRQNATRACARGETTDAAAATSTWLKFIKGYVSLQICSEAASGHGGTAGATVSETAPIVDVHVPLCSPHLLNFSTAAFLEWVLYGWMPRLSASLSLPQQRLRLVFSFHPDVCSLPSAAPVGGIGLGAAVTTMNKDTVTLVVDSVPLLQIQYPPAVLPSPPLCSDAGLPDEASTADAWYALHDADELEETLDGFRSFLASFPESTAPDQLPKLTDSDKTPGAVNAPPPPSAPASRSTTLFRHLCEQVKLAWEALHESRSRGEAAATMFLRSLRQRLIPALMSDYRDWQVEARRTACAKAAPASPATTTTSHDGSDVAATLNLSADRGVLRSLENCYFHPGRAQWIRLGEPTSVLAVALELLYGGVTAASPASPSSPVAARDAKVPPLHGSLTPAAAQGNPHVNFAVHTESPLMHDPRSSSATSSTHTRDSSPIPYDQQLQSTAALTRAEALDILRRCGKMDAARPVSLACSLRGYKPVLPLNRSGNAGGGGGGVASSIGSGAVSTVNAIVEASALRGLGGGGGGSSGGGGGGSGSDGGELNITVEVLFPHGFAALHVLYTDGAPLDFPAALLRSRPYITDGGKSQSRFFITEDERFLLKCIKPMELRYFKEWAPRYFARMADYYSPSPSSTSSASSQNFSSRQSTLGKLLGLYVVHVQGSRSRSAAQPTAGDAALPPQQQQPLRSFLPDGAHCFMVAEQLLFQRPVRETWDLKGSQRNRTTEHTAAVRLDVDLVQERLRHGDFFFCAPEAKSLLMDHLSRDTQLLCDSGIMDYSLMASVGGEVDAKGGGNLYVGMIDFLHPYSSAKVFESKMKSGLDTVLGYGRRDPTIIDPSSYATRFMLWMDGYFSGVPDRLFPLTRVQLLAERNEANLAAAAAAAGGVEDDDALAST